VKKSLSPGKKKTCKKRVSKPQFVQRFITKEAFREKFRAAVENHPEGKAFNPFDFHLDRILTIINRPVGLEYIFCWSRAVSSGIHPKM